MTHIRNAIMEEHRASIEAYKKVHEETVRSELRMAIVQHNMEMDIYDIKQVPAQRREQMRKEWNRREEWNEKIEKLKNLIQSFIRNPISPVKTPPGTTKVPAKPIQNTSLFEENSGQSFCSDEVEKEVKDISFKGALFTGSEVVDGYGGENLPQTDSILKNLNSEVISTCIGSSESTNNQENMITNGAGDQSRVPEKDVPSHGPRKQQLGGLILGAEVEIHVRFYLRTFEGLHCDLGRGQERRTWNPGITYHRRNILSGLINKVSQHFELLAYRHAKRIVQRRVWDHGITHGDNRKQHLEDKVFLRAGVLIRTFLIVSLLIFI
ncbi:hypothetical protein Tco_1298123 [Tanacetum coccineum]